VLLEPLIEARADIREGIDPSLLERERASQARLTDASARLSRLLTEKADEQQTAAVRAELEALGRRTPAIQTEIRQHSPATLR
jgi:hypothetical protein